MESFGSKAEMAKTDRNGKYPDSEGREVAGGEIERWQCSESCCKQW